MYCELFIYQELKLKFYQLLIELSRHEGSYLATCKYYKAVYDTPIILEDSDKKHQVTLRLINFDKKPIDILTQLAVLGVIDFVIHHKTRQSCHFVII